MTRFFYDTDKGLSQGQPLIKLFSVTLQDFFCPSNNVLHALSARVAMQPKLQILWGIIQSIAIFMMYPFILFQRTPKTLFHNITMFHHPLAWCDPDQGVSVIIDHAPAICFHIRFWFSWGPFAWACKRVPIPKNFFVVRNAIPFYVLGLFAPINGAFLKRLSRFLLRRKHPPSSKPTIVSHTDVACVGLFCAIFHRTYHVHIIP